MTTTNAPASAERAHSIHRITTVHRGWRQSARGVVECPNSTEPVDVARCHTCEHLRRETEDSVFCAVETTSEMSVEPGSVGEAMTRDVLCISPGVCIEDAARLMIERNIGALPVVDGEQRILGMITRSDIMPVLLQTIVAGSNGLDSFDANVAHRAKCDAAADIMKRDVLRLTPNDPIERAAELFAARRIHRAPVVAWNGAVIGMCSTFDLVTALAEADARQGSGR